MDAAVALVAPGILSSQMKMATVPSHAFWKGVQSGCFVTIGSGSPLLAEPTSLTFSLS